ncbi:MAG: glycogen/starch/alpha-glucan family phosphorylase [Lachnospiraceae bacterium]|jgi:starch phosphorylase|nr:glycogen/starch/alpha-glucan family phosphorylase [Lachnospiraceae bacterium]MCH4063540.1 glycogen/starch/alpha-glucan family phosphorylase [Lachnospiraceae bacterium]MCI1455220.1 glycogen/starch/alpha-glucan family phosphorylase [Lachnospiraceae bacterium]
MANYSLASYTKKPLADCTTLELFNAAIDLTQDAAKNKGYNEGKKKLYYISAEFLIGKLLSNNLINLRLYDDVKAELAAAGKNITDLEEFEYEPSLGNGGLGRLAACFVDSLATLGLPADGVGLAYHCGLFRQSFVDRRQYESPDNWLKWGQESWMRRTDKQYTVHFGGFDIKSTMYEIDVTGYHGKSGRLRLFDVDSIDERVIHNRISFDKTKIAKNLTLFLYPDDSDEEGRILRVYQEYFMVANAVQLMLDEAKAKGSNLHDLADYCAVQINDTHPTMVIPELIRVLGENGIGTDEAIKIVTDVCGYTNHTILAEALEKWPRYYLEKAVPHLMPIIEDLDKRVRAKYDDPFVYIIDDQNNVHMANIDIHFSHSVNGVAALHTEILKHTELAPFYKIYPEKFNNKTNGITFRRWIRECNPRLSALISSKIGDGWKHNADELEKLLAFQDDEKFLEDLMAVKHENKKAFAAWIDDHQGAKINPESIFDVQSKRLHEYKRQQLNLLWAIRKYQEIKAGKKPAQPITVIFGAKAAPAYIIAKDIIHAIICLGDVIANDPEVSPYMKVVMIENYNVTAAEKLIPACDISEQISLASKEASGTGNMKFMLNGALTLGTMDGANVEIAELVGKDNIYTFGESSDTVIARYARGDYRSRDYYEKDPVLHKAVDFLTGPEMLALGNEECLTRLKNELLNKDWFMTFPDYTDYCETKERMLQDTQDKKAWAKKTLINIAKAGFFSSDRTIRQYNDEIWHLTPDK